MATAYYSKLKNRDLNNGLVMLLIILSNIFNSSIWLGYTQPIVTVHFFSVV